MSKKNLTTISDKDSIFDIVNSIDQETEILSESKTALISDYIDTGSYILNACMTGSLFKGVPAGRVVTFAGLPGCLQKNETLKVYKMKSVENRLDLHKVITEK